MVRVAGIVSELLQEFARNGFATLVKKHDAKRGSKGFGCWPRVVATLFCHVATADSLRQVRYGRTSFLGELRHLGIERAPNKSTLSYADERRPAGMFETLFYTALARFRQQGRIGCREPKPLQELRALPGVDANLALSVVVFVGQVSAGRAGRQGLCAPGSR